MMKKKTLLLLLVSMMIPMMLSAQKVKKDVLTDGALLKGNSSMLKKNVPAPADKKVQKLSNFIKGNSLRRAPKAAPSADAIIWDFEDESQLDDWTFVDRDRDGYNWELQTSQYATHSGSGVMVSASYDEDSSIALTPDNWLISPEVTLDGVLSFWACGQDKTYSKEVFGVFVCVGNSTKLTDFVQVGTNITTTSAMTQYDFDLSQFAGKTGRFAIRHYNCSDMFYLNIDDVCLDANATFLPDPTDPTNLTADPAATTADVTWDGAEGDSWNLRYKVIDSNALSFLWDFTFENYEELLDEGWSVMDFDGDGNTWYLSLGGFDPSGDLDYYNNVSWGSDSWNEEEGGIEPMNGLVTPEVPLGGTFSFWAASLDEDYPDEVLGVYVLTDEDFEQIGEDFTTTADWTEYSFDTSKFEGKTGSLLIVHYKCYDQFIVNVDYFSYEKDNEPWIEVNGLTDTQYTIEGLEPGTDYMVEVMAYNDKTETKWSEPTYFTTETGIDVSVSATGYATLYYGNLNLVVPEGVEASAINVEGGSMTQSQVYTAGDIIPQGTGVLLQASQGDYVFDVTSEEGTAASANMLRGSDEAEETTGGDIYLMLSLNANSDPESVGFYYGAEGGAPFINGAHKAYLALTDEQAAGVKYFLFNTTGINNIQTVENSSKDVFTVTGMHVNKHSNLPKGFYIVGGKKVVVK